MSKKATQDLGTHVSGKWKRKGRMPIYEYQCSACGYKLEKLQKISDAPLRDCPSCAKPTLSKLVSAAAFRLKGGGWYETDFKSKGKKNVLHGTDSGSDSSSSESSGSDNSGGDGKTGDSGNNSDSKASAAAT